MKIAYKPVEVIWEKGHLKFDLVNLKCTNHLIYKVNTQGSGISLTGLQSIQHNQLYGIQVQQYQPLTTQQINAQQQLQNSYSQYQTQLSQSAQLQNANKGTGKK